MRICKWKSTKLSRTKRVFSTQIMPESFECAVVYAIVVGISKLVMYESFSASRLQCAIFVALVFIFYTTLNSLSKQYTHKKQKENESRRLAKVGLLYVKCCHQIPLNYATLFEGKHPSVLLCAFNYCIAVFFYAFCFGFECKRSNNNCTNWVASMLLSCAPMHCCLCLWYSKGISSWHIH